MHPEPHLGLVVVLHGHGDDVDPDDEGDEKVEVVAGAQRVDGAAGGRVVSVVGPALGLCRERAPVTRARWWEWGWGRAPGSDVGGWQEGAGGRFS